MVLFRVVLALLTSAFVPSTLLVQHRTTFFLARNFYRLAVVGQRRPQHSFRRTCRPPRLRARLRLIRKRLVDGDAHLGPSQRWHGSKSLTDRLPPGRQISQPDASHVELLGRSRSFISCRPARCRTFRLSAWQRHRSPWRYMALPLGKVGRLHHPGIGHWPVGPLNLKSSGRSAREIHQIRLHQRAKSARQCLDRRRTNGRAARPASAWPSEYRCGDAPWRTSGSKMC